MNRYNWLAKTAAAGALLLSSISGFAQQEDEQDLFDLPLEDLMNVEITSVSKKAERLQDVTSSIYVLTSEDIRKSGATTLHEALRTVPGYWGAQDEYSSVSPSIRVSPAGLSESGTVLYLLDGTPIQNLMNSSFSFRNFDIPLSQIDRIEVIRGSGGTIYGANSATGVVNIFTKKPGDYSGLHVNLEGATPGYAAASLSAGGVISDKVSLSGYAKMRYFSGFESMAGVDEQGNTTVERSRFTQNYDESTMGSAGLGLEYAITPRTTLSLRSHFNTLSKYDYINYVTDQSLDPISQTITNDVLVEEKVNSSRFVSNVRLDHTFSDQHNVFFRISTNRENDFSKLGGGYNVSNAIYDVEAQDNIALGPLNDLSFGGNFRIVDYDIYDINYLNGINYLNPQSRESLKGAFVQNKIKLLAEKLNVTLGIKAENFSLLNNKFYLSPMAKVSYLPNENVTLWGGYTKSFTTPGYNLTNIDIYVFETPPYETWAAVATQAIYGQVYQATYQSARERGVSEEDAAAAAASSADDYIASEEGQTAITTTATGLIAQTPDVAAKNGNTTPTEFQTWELGARGNIARKWLLETNLFYTTVSDEFAASVNPVYEESITQPGRYAAYLRYGNYAKGITMGTESMVRFYPSSKLNFELAHTYLTSTWEYQENEDFDISDPSVENNQTPTTPEMPEHMIKFRSSLNVGKGVNVSAGIIYVSKFATEAQYKFDDERYPAILFPEPATLVAENASRTIVNLRVEKKLLGDHMALYAFGNDIFNKGIIAQTDFIYNTTLSKIGAMYGLGLHYKLSGK